MREYETNRTIHRLQKAASLEQYPRMSRKARSLQVETPVPNVYAIECPFNSLNITLDATAQSVGGCQK
jgi:hypothetical protein